MRNVLPLALFLLSAAPCLAQEPSFRVDGDYVVWWLRRSYLPPVLTDGVRTVYGDQRLETRHNDRFIGGRMALEYTGPNLGVEGRFFFLERDSTYRTIDPVTTPLAFTFLDANTGQPAREVVAGLDPARGPLEGGFVGYSRVELFGQEVNAVIPMEAGEGWKIDLLAGARFLQMRDRYHHTATSRNLAPLFGFEPGAVLYGVQDNIRVHNAFYGAQLGVRGEADFGRWFVNGRVVGALGADDQLVRTKAERVFHTPAARATAPVGLFVQPSNTGRFRRCHLDGVGEFACNLGWRVTDHLALTVGYTFLVWLDPARATEQVETVLNTRQAQGGPPVPGVSFKGDAFWAQGLNLGVSVRW